MSGSESLHVVFRLFIHVFPLEIQLSSEDGWDPNCWFNTATFVSLSIARTWIYNIICPVQWVKL